MNSQRWSKPLSFASGISLMRITIESTIAFLYSNPPSSLRMLLRKFILWKTRDKERYLKKHTQIRTCAVKLITILNQTFWNKIKYCIWYPTHRALYFSGNFKHNDLMASTTTILNSSAISDMKLVICFIKRSTLDSFPVFKSVVIASVAMLLFWSEIKLSISMLQFVTAIGCVIATWKKFKHVSIIYQE